MQDFKVIIQKYFEGLCCMKIAIVGGGISGLLAAWLLDGLADIQLFESQDRLGGHAYTYNLSVEGKVIPVEMGFEFFNEKMFPNLCKLLQVLAIATRDFQLTYAFHVQQSPNAIVMPPLQKSALFWRSLLPGPLSKLLQCSYVIAKARDIVRNSPKGLTLEQFLNDLYITTNFKETFFYPLLAAGWGVPIDEFKKFSAHDVLAWMVQNGSSGTWKEIVAGTASYIDALTKSLLADIHLSSKIVALYKEGAYYKLQDAHGNYFYADHVILATNAYQANKLLQQLDLTQIAQAALSKVDYFRTAIAVHADHRFMPMRKADWSIANVCFDGKSSNLTIYKEWKSSFPHFRSWLVSPLFLPQPLYELKHFYHAKVTPEYFESQQLLETVQGKDNLWFAGIYTTGIDSHESSIVSAIRIVERLMPHSDRLNQLIGK